MGIVVIGVSHKSSDSDIRGKLSFSAEEMSNTLDLFKNKLFIYEAFIVSTCNRVEIYCICDNVDTLLSWWAETKQFCLHRLKKLVYIYKADQAIEHAMRVASSLDSMVLGEPQILGQFKAAIAKADELGMISSKLHFIIKHVLATAKKVRHQTAIGYCPVSVPLSATKILQPLITQPENSKVLFIGSGATIKHMLKHISQLGIKKPFIANRTIAKAKTLAAEYGGIAYGLEQLPEILKTVDLVISATQAEEPIIITKMLPTDKNIICFDLAIPFDIDIEAKNLKNISLFNMDDIQSLVNNNTIMRSQAAIKANEIIDGCLSKYKHARQTLDASSTVSAMRKQVKSITELELNKALALLQAGEDPEQVLREYSYTITHKWLHAPSISLNKAGALGQVDMVELAQYLFALPYEDNEGIN